MVTLMDQIFKYRLNQTIAFRDPLTKEIMYGCIQNRWIDYKKRMYSVKVNELVTVCEWDVIGFIKEKK